MPLHSDYSGERAMQKKNSLNFILLALIFAVLASTQACAASDQISVIVGGKKLGLKHPARLVNGAVYAPLAVLDSVGADYSRHDDSIKIEPASGDKFTCKATKVDDEWMLPLMEIAERLGAKANWDAERSTLHLQAQVKSIEIDEKNIRVETSYPVTAATYNTDWTRSQGKLILDLKGVVIRNFSDVSVKNDLGIPISTGVQDAGETARLVFSVPKGSAHRLTNFRASKEITVTVSGLRREEVTQQISSVSDPTPATVTDINYHKLSDKEVQVVINTTAPTKYTTYMYRDPDSFVIDLPRAILTKDIKDIDVGREFVQNIQAAERDNGTVRITVNLTRVVGFSVQRNDREGKLMISLQMPKGAGGQLGQKTIVIDPGHGGRETGAMGVNGQPEKNTNLAIALKVQKLLMDAGVCALITRDSDETVDLNERGAFAVRHSADLFLSIHGNSCAVPNSMSGIETYYHSTSPSGRALAQCLQSEVMKVADMPNRNAKSDSILYKSGLAVLRGTTGAANIPAALIEVGFVNNRNDIEKITDPDYQMKIAQAIVRGMRLYVEGRTSPLRKTEAEPVVEDKPVLASATNTEIRETPKSTPKSADEPHRPGEIAK